MKKKYYVSFSFPVSFKIISSIGSRMIVNPQHANLVVEIEEETNAFDESLSRNKINLLKEKILEEIKSPAFLTRKISGELYHAHEIEKTLASLNKEHVVILYTEEVA